MYRGACGRASHRDRRLIMDIILKRGAYILLDLCRLYACVSLREIYISGHRSAYNFPQDTTEINETVHIDLAGICGRLTILQEKLLHSVLYNHVKLVPTLTPSASDALPSILNKAPRVRGKASATSPVCLYTVCSLVSLSRGGLSSELARRLSLQQIFESVLFFIDDEGKKIIYELCSFRCTVSKFRLSTASSSCSSDMMCFSVNSKATCSSTAESI